MILNFSSNYIKQAASDLCKIHFYLILLSCLRCYILGSVLHNKWQPFCLHQKLDALTLESSSLNHPTAPTFSWVTTPIQPPSLSSLSQVKAFIFDLFSSNLFSRYSSQNQSIATQTGPTSSLLPVPTEILLEMMDYLTLEEKSVIGTIDKHGLRISEIQSVWTILVGWKELEKRMDTLL